MLPTQFTRSRLLFLGLCASLAACGGPMHNDAGGDATDARADTVGDTTRDNGPGDTGNDSTTSDVPVDNGSDVAVDEGVDTQPPADVVDVPVPMDVPVDVPMDVAMDVPVADVPVADVPISDVTDASDAVDVAPDVITPGCGNNVLEAGEQCDDGNRLNLDGCSSTCRYEMVTRITDVGITRAQSPSGCTPRTNAFGQAFSNLAVGQLNGTLQTSVADGSINLLMDFLNLDDLTGVADTSLTVGLVGASADPARGAWPGNNPIDWWFLADGNGISAGLPTGVLMPGAIAARVLTAGPGSVSLPLSLSGAPLNLQMNQARVTATINNNPAPNRPAPPPNMLAAGITAFQTITASATGQGLCGNVTVQSLSHIPVPSTLTNGTFACAMCASGSRAYTACMPSQTPGVDCNSLLDVLVGGCNPVCGSTLLNVVTPTQPDVAGSGTVRALSLGTGNRVPASQITGNTDAYSSYLTFTANRTHITGQTCTATSQCQTGQTCTSGVCR